MIRHLLHQETVKKNMDIASVMSPIGFNELLLYGGAVYRTCHSMQHTLNLCKTLRLNYMIYMLDKVQFLLMVPFFQDLEIELA